MRFLNPNIDRLQASDPKHAPPGGFLETTFFGKLIHRQVEIRLSAKISTLGEAMRALFQNGLQNTIYCLITIQIIHFLAILFDI